MARIFTPKAVTANRLLEGDVVYLTPTGTWSQNLSDAWVLTSQEKAEEMLADASTQSDIVVGAYLADVVTNEEGETAPVHFREKFRMRGPSNYFHGKQAQV